MNAPYTHAKADQKRLTEYFEAQWETPYQSTIQFNKWLSETINFQPGQRYLDLGCGMGSNAYYLSQNHEESLFEGIDIDVDLVNQGNQLIQKKRIENVNLSQDDWFNLRKEHINRYSGIVSLQTLMMFKEFQSPINRVIDLNPDWFAISSLFFDGDIETATLIKDYTYDEPKEYYYSTFSIARIQELCAQRGYPYFSHTPFEIEIDLERKTGWTGMGTYTERLDDGRKLQISGPLLMNWRFIIASKTPLSR